MPRYWVAIDHLDHCQQGARRRLLVDQCAGKEEAVPWGREAAVGCRGEPVEVRAFLESPTE